MYNINAFGSVDQAFFDNIVSEAQNANEPININLGSSGGNTEIGIRLYYYLRNNVPNLTITGMGDISSIAVIVFLAADTRLITENAKVLIHTPTLTLNGEYNVVKLREYEASLVNDIDRYCGIFHERTKGFEGAINITEEVNGRASRVLNAYGALSAGIATRIIPGK